MSKRKHPGANSGVPSGSSSTNTTEAMDTTNSLSSSTGGTNKGSSQGSEGTSPSVGRNAQQLTVSPRDKSLFRSLKAELSRLNKQPASASGATIKGKEKQAREMISRLLQKFEADSYLIIFDIMPAKIDRLDKLFSEAPAFQASLEELQQEIKVPLRSSGSGSNSKDNTNNNQLLPCNKIIVELENSLKHEILEMTEYMNTLSIWIQLNVPRIQDGNNFGVEVQTEIISVLESAAESGFAVLATFTDYHVVRGGLLAKVRKHPDIEDYRRAVTELDERFYIKTASVSLDLRNSYLVIFDHISKNLSKIETPRAKEPSFMY